MSKKRRPITINNKYFPLFDSDSKPIRKQINTIPNVKGNEKQLLYYATGTTDKLLSMWIITIILSILNYFGVIELNTFWLLFPILFGSFGITVGYYLSRFVFRLDGTLKIRTN